MKYVSIDVETTGLNPKKHQILSLGAVIEDTNNQLPIEKMPKFEGVILHDEVVGNPIALSMNKELLKMIGDYQSLKSYNDKINYEKSVDKRFFYPNEIIPQFWSWLVCNGFTSKDTKESLINSFIQPKDLEKYNENIFTIPSIITKESVGPIQIGGIYENIDQRVEKTKIVAAGKNFSKFDRQFLEQLPFFNSLISINSRAIDPGTMYIDWEKDLVPPNLSKCKERASLKDTHITHNAVKDAIDVIKCVRYKINNGYELSGNL